MLYLKHAAIAAFFLMSTSTAFAQPDTVSYAYKQTGDCAFTAGKISQSASYKIRFEKRCELTRLQTLQTFNNLFAKLDSEEVEMKNLGIGRLVDWGWLGRSIHQYAETSPLWPKNRKIHVSAAFSNKFVENALQEVLLEPLLSSNNAGMLQRFHSFSCEKILLDKDRLPYDGLCWITFK